MPRDFIEYRLRIRNAADSADDLVISSVVGDTAPFVLEPPKGDGNDFDPVSGKVSIGAYTFPVIDADTGGGVRVVTNKLTDTAGRQQLLNRRAYGEIRRNGGAWQVLVPGYVNAVRLTTPLVYEVVVGQTRRIEVSTQLFKKAAGNLDGVSCIIGGPMRGQFPFMRDAGGWRVQVTNVYSGTQKCVELTVLQKSTYGATTPGAYAPLDVDEFNIAMNVGSLYVPTTEYQGLLPTTDVYKGIVGQWSNHLVRLENPDGSLANQSIPLAQQVSTKVYNTTVVAYAPVALGKMYVKWTASQPAIGTQFNMYMYAADINEQNPLYIFDHPVTIITKIWDIYSIAYDAASTAAMVSLIGADIRVAMYITKAYSMADFTAAIMAMFGIATRPDALGRLVMFRTRVKNNAPPSRVVTTSDLRSYDDPIFDLDEQTITNQVIVKTKRFDLSAGIKAIDQTVQVDDGDTTAAGQRGVTYDIPGAICTVSAPTTQGFDSSNTVFTPLELFAIGIGEELFDHVGRGGIFGTLHCLPTVTDQVGDEIILDLPHLPNLNVRGGQRIVQIIQRTETPSGPDLRILDSGSSAQLATVPTATLAADAADPTGSAVLTLTNAAALVAQSSKVRVEWGTGAVQPSAGTLLGYLDPATQTKLNLPKVDAGTKVWVIMRAERKAQRPSAYSSWLSVALTALSAPSGLAHTAVNGNEEDLSWTNTDTVNPVEVRYRLTSQAANAWLPAITLPAGSTRVRVSGLLVNTQYQFDVRIRQAAPYNGVSSSTQLTVTTGAVGKALTAPTNPNIFAGYKTSTGQLRLDGTYGLEVVATVLPGYVEFELAVETAVGSGTPGAYSSVGKVVAAQGTPTRVQLTAPNDGKLRYLRARHVDDNATPSGYTTALSINPWTSSTAGAVSVPCPAILQSNEEEESLTFPVCIVLLSYAVPSSLYFNRMEFDIKAGSLTAARHVGGTSSPVRVSLQWNTSYTVTPWCVSKDGVATLGTPITFTTPNRRRIGIVPLIRTDTGADVGYPFRGASSDSTGLTADSATKDSRSALLSSMFRFGVDDATGVVETGAKVFVSPTQRGYADRAGAGLDTSGNMQADRTVSGGSQPIGAVRELVPNADFDIWTSASQPWGWSVDTTGGAVAAKDTAVKLTGAAALKYSNPDNASSGGWHGVTSQVGASQLVMRLKAGKKYRILVASRTSQFGAGQKYRAWIYFNAAGTLSAQASFNYKAANAWQMDEWLVTVPSTAEANQTLLIQFNRNGNATATDFWVDTVDIGEALPSVTAVDASGNIIALGNVVVPTGTTLQVDGSFVARGPGSLGAATADPFTGKRVEWSNGDLMVKGDSAGAEAMKVVLGSYATLNKSTLSSFSDTSVNTLTCNCSADTNGINPNVGSFLTSNPAAGPGDVRGNYPAYDNVYKIPWTLQTTITTDATKFQYVDATLRYQYSTDGGTNWSAAASVATVRARTSTVSSSSTLSITAPSVGTTNGLKLRFWVETQAFQGDGTFASGTGTATMGTITWKKTTGSAINHRGAFFGAENGHPNFTAEPVTTPPTHNFTTPSLNQAAAGDIWFRDADKLWEYSDNIRSLKLDNYQEAVMGANSGAIGTSATTLTELPLQVKSGEVWDVEWVYFYVLSTTTATSSVGIAGPAGSTGYWWGLGTSGAPAGANTPRMAINAFGGAPGTGGWGAPGSAAPNILIVRARLTAGADGTFNIQPWCSAGTLTVQAKSFMTARRRA